MARELVLGANMPVRDVYAMTFEEVRYWYEAALTRQKELREQQP